VNAVQHDISLLEGMATTRAIRRFRSDPIPEADLATMFWLASRAPSGSNRQPFRFVVLRDGPAAREARGLLGQAFRAEWATKRSADGYDAGTGVEAGSRKARMANAMQQFVDRFEETPVVVLACHEPYRALSPFDGANVYPACQNLLLAARALGYGGVMTMWHVLVDEPLRAVLDIPVNTFIAATVALGRPEGSHGPVRRRPLGEIVYEDKWAQPASWARDPEGTRFAGGPRRPQAPR
jgi:nitroreductase